MFTKPKIISTFVKNIKIMVNETIKLYNYQKDATDFVLDNIDETHVLLAAAPNAGKTFMASFIIKELVKNGARVLCSVYGTNVLKRQFYDSICNIVQVECINPVQLEPADMEKVYGILDDLKSNFDIGSKKDSN